MAMVKASLEAAFAPPPPMFQYFNNPPFFLGGFEDIVHVSGGKPKPKWFEATLDFEEDANQFKPHAKAHSKPIRYTVRFARHGIAFLPVTRRFEYGDMWAEVNFKARRNSYEGVIKFGIKDREWELKSSQILRGSMFESRSCVFILHRSIDEVFYCMDMQGRANLNSDFNVREILSTEHDFAKQDRGRISDFLIDLVARCRYSSFGAQNSEFFASSPIRFEPSRIYDPNDTGLGVPGYLANLKLTNDSEWRDLKSKLESFGSDSGLFNEIRLEFMQKSVASSPFRLLFRERNGRNKSEWRNLIDIGYGVSQALPLLVDLLRSDSASVIFLQQPEVHLHPQAQAQASFGSLICQLVAAGKRIFLETHSDNILDRIRMDIRDKVVNLRCNDVCTLFFEKTSHAANIHTMGFNEQGNIINAPDNYRKFFLDEVDRDILAGYSNEAA